MRNSNLITINNEKVGVFYIEPYDEDLREEPDRIKVYDSDGKYFSYVYDGDIIPLNLQKYTNLIALLEAAHNIVDVIDIVGETGGGFPTERRNTQMFKNTTLNYTRINKSEARKLYNLGRPIAVLPCKANPNSPWFSNSTVSKESTDKNFDTLVNEFAYYNCNTAELGRRPAFYVLTINE